MSSLNDKIILLLVKINAAKYLYIIWMLKLSKKFNAHIFQVEDLHAYKIKIQRYLQILRPFLLHLKKINKWNNNFTSLQIINFKLAIYL